LEDQVEQIITKIIMSLLAVSVEQQLSEQSMVAQHQHQS
jgi:hypothetical protein